MNENRALKPKKRGFSLMLMSLMLMWVVIFGIFTPGAESAFADGVSINTLKIHVVDSTPKHSPLEGVRLRIAYNINDRMNYVKDAVSDAEGYALFDLSGLGGKYEIVFDSLQNYMYYSYDLVVDGGTLVSIEGEYPETEDFCFELTAAPEILYVTCDARGGRINGEAYTVFDSIGSHLLWGQENDDTPYVKIEEGELYDLDPEESINTLTAPEGYELDAWYTDDEDGARTRVAELKTKFYAEKNTIYALWKNVISFNPNGGSGNMGNQTFFYNEPLCLSQNSFTSPDGLTFAGWNTRKDGTGESFGDGEELTNPRFKTLYAQWVDESVTVLVDSAVRNGKITADPVGAKAGDTVTLTLTPDDGCAYVQDSLRVMQGDTPVEASPAGDGMVWTFTMPAQGRVSVSASFAYIPYGITFADTQHGGVSVYQARENYRFGETVMLIAAPEIGYELDKLTVTDGDGHEVPLESDNSFVMPMSNVSVSASFRGKPYPVTLVYKGSIQRAQVLPSATPVCGETVTISPDPGVKITGLSVTGLNGDVIEVRERSFTMPPQEVVVRVNCSFISYRVSLNVDSGGSVTGLEAGSYYYGKVLRFDAEPDDAHELGSISLTAEDGTEFPVEKVDWNTWRFTVPASAVTLNVQFPEKQIHTVSYYDGNELLKEVSVPHGGIVYEEDKPQVQAPAGMAFFGWYEGNTYFSPDAEFTRDVNLTARFGSPVVRSLKLHITDDSDGGPVEGLPVYICSDDLYDTFLTAVTDSSGYAEFDLNRLAAYGEERVRIGKEIKTERYDVTYTVWSGRDGSYSISIYDLKLGRDSGGNYIVCFREQGREYGPGECYEIDADPVMDGQDYVPLTPSTTVLENNKIYVARGGLEIAGRIEVRGSATLILDDGAVLTAANGIHVAQGCSLTIHGRVDGGSAGALIASANGGAAAIGGNENEAGGDIIINGGNIIATGGNNAPAIGAGSGSGSHGSLTIGNGMYVYGGDDAGHTRNIAPEAGGYARTHYMAVNSSSPVPAGQDEPGQEGKPSGSGQQQPAPGSGSGNITVGALIYNIQNGTATVTGTINKKAKKISVPDTIMANGQTVPVTAIAPKAFAGMKKLGSATIGANIETIGAKAFFKCKNLKKIKIKTAKLTKKTVGKNAFGKTHPGAKVKVPKKKRKAYRKFLYKKGLRRSAKIS